MEDKNIKRDNSDRWTATNEYPYSISANYSRSKLTLTRKLTREQFELIKKNYLYAFTFIDWRYFG